MSEILTILFRISGRFQRLTSELYKAKTEQKVPISDSWDQPNKKFRFQTVGTKLNAPISDTWDQTEHKSSDFRHLGPNRMIKFRFQTVKTKPNVPISDVRFGPNCLKLEHFERIVKVPNDQNPNHPILESAKFLISALYC